jgi:hypothetical protein
MNLIKYLEEERKKDPEFKKLLPKDGEPMTHDQVLRFIQNDMKYLKKEGIGFRQMWVSDREKGEYQYHVQPDIEQ